MNANAITPPYAGAPGTIRPTLAEPQRIGDLFPATLTKLRTLQEVRQSRVPEAAARFRQAVEDLRGGAS